MWEGGYLKFLCSKLWIAFCHQTARIGFLKLPATDNILLLEPKALIKSVVEAKIQL